MQELIARFDHLIDLVRAQNELLTSQNLLLRTFVEAMVREEDDAIPMQQLKELLDTQRGSQPNISTMDRDDAPD